MKTKHPDVTTVYSEMVCTLLRVMVIYDAIQIAKYNE
jgi:hypothetical protein